MDEAFKRHRTAAGHPERPARLDAVIAGLEQGGWVSECAAVAAVAAPVELLTAVHDPAYVRRAEATCAAGRPYLDCADTSVCEESYEVARLAAGGVVEAARRIGRGELTRAFCAVRPPGHHAEHAVSMGFCLFNNVVLAASVLRREFGMERVLILDWDVHHGNGTQHLLEADPSVLFVSLHGHPDTLYPGTGYEHETGIGAGEGFTVNVPFRPGAGDDDYRAAFRQRVVPAVERFEPQMVVISAGFDAHEADPLADIRLSDGGFAWMTRETLRLAGRFAEDRVLSVLEGGYNLEVLKRCTAEHVERLCG